MVRRGCQANTDDDRTSRVLNCGDGFSECVNHSVERDARRGWYRIVDPQGRFVNRILAFAIHNRLCVA